MTIHAIAHLVSWWLFWHPAVAEPEEARPLRLIDRPCLHVGVRPAASFGEGVAVTVQVSACDPF